MDEVDPSGLAYTDQGRADGAPIVLVHGFTQSRRCWAPFDRLLAAHHLVRTVDAPGHGESGHADADLHTAAALLCGSGGTASAYLGYSMGGRLCLQLALDRPTAVRRLVLIGASPGIEDHGERDVRRRADEALAAHLLEVGLDRFLDEWLAQPMFRGLTKASSHRAERMRNDPVALAASLRSLGVGVQPPMWQRLHELAMPMLLVVGSRDHKYVDIAHRMRDAVGANAEVAVIERAGHTAHLEQPEQTAERVLDWLSHSASTF